MTTDKPISLQTLQRMPLYLDFLKGLPETEARHISARTIADALSFGEIQVRKDLASVSDGGRPKTGFARQELIADIEEFLGCNDVNEAILVGAGNLGRALMSYNGFHRYGLQIIAAFDSNASALGTQVGGKPVYGMERLSEICKSHDIRIGVITTPADQAQEICETLAKNGILAIWNFAPTRLKAPEGILIQNENMAASLALLRRHLKETMQPDQPLA